MRVKGLLWQSQSREEVVVENKCKSSRLNHSMYTANGERLPIGSATTIRQSMPGAEKRGFSWLGGSNGGERGFRILEKYCRIETDNLARLP